MGVWIETCYAARPIEQMEVTPFVGVWIETPADTSATRDAMSHPSWVCGLKLENDILGFDPSQVTPFVGVWIETKESDGTWTINYVTPFVGVWIETQMRQRMLMATIVTPFVGVWIETRETS